MDAFERALQGRFPDNRILSHDLVESCYARSGLLSDVQVYEEYPATYSADVSRRHRWIRGDWQLLRWLLPWVPGGAERRAKPDQRAFPLETLRQSSPQPGARGADLVAAAELGVLAAARVLDPGRYRHHPDSGILAGLQDLVRKPKEVLWRQHLSSVAEQRGPAWLRRRAFTLACLPYEAYFSLDAILRTLWRMLVSRRRLLEWSAVQRGQPERRRQPGRVVENDVGRSGGRAGRPALP